MHFTNLVFILSADDADERRIKGKNLRESAKSANPLVKNIITSKTRFLMEFTYLPFAAFFRHLILGELKPKNNPRCHNLEHIR
jgi:hypothetical protein